MSEDNRAELVRLIQSHLEERKLNTTQFVASFPDTVGKRTIYTWLSGSKVPGGPSARSALEEALGWKRGSVREVLAARVGTRFELSELRDWEKLGVEPEPARASDLPIDELLVALTKSVGALQRDNEILQREVEILRARESGSNVVDMHARSAYGLAANSTDAARNMEHLED